MSKYKAGDKVTVLIETEATANALNAGRSVDFYKGEIIAHEPAPEPIVRYIVTSKNYGYETLSEAQRNMRAYYGNSCQIVKTTYTGNDFTVEKVG